MWEDNIDRWRCTRGKSINFTEEIVALLIAAEDDCDVLGVIAIVTGYIIRAQIIVYLCKGTKNRLQME